MRKFLLLALLIVCLIPVGALAAGIDDLWVTGTIEGAEPEVNAVHWWYGSKVRQHYLFLPACADPGALTLNYTGSHPLEINGAPVESGKPFAFTPGETLSLTCGKKKYTLNVMQSAGVPTLFIETESGSMDYIHKKKGNKESGSLVIVNPDGSFAYNGELDEIKGRGNSTFNLNKKPYQIKLADKTDLYGMGKHKTWILLANYRDNSLLRNTTTFQMARAAGLMYTPQSIFCDVYINHEYFGNYELCTKVQIDDNRIEIDDLEKATEKVNDADLDSYERIGRASALKGKSKSYDIPNDPEDITGGYLLEIDYANRYVDEASGYTTKKGLPVVIKEPEYATEAQAAFVSNLLQGLENGLRAKDGIDPDTGKHYTEFIDLDSFVTKYLIEEIVKNYDGNKSSQYFFKPVDSVSTKLIAGPVWDYDSSYGNYAGKKTTAPATGFSICSDRAQSFYLYPSAYRQEDFRWRAQELYTTVFVPILEALLGEGSEELGIVSLDAYAEQLEATAAMNFKRWPVFNVSARPIKTGADYEANIEYLKTFLEKRMAFLEEEWVIPYQNGQVAEKP